MSARLFNLIYG
ncbi:hypothetical protein MJ574_06850 [Escherichia coli]|nr:hypothetical protein MJ574_06850 [Escherichia coli]UMY03783.1 hypothetical protein MJ564_06320 [Escherichia coli]